MNNFTKEGSIVPSVSAKQVRGEISGRTAKAVSPTSPRVTLLSAPVFKDSPRRGATMGILVRIRADIGIGVTRTVDQHAIHKGVHRPDIGSPICMAKTPGEGEQPAQKLRELILQHKGTKCGPKNGGDAAAQLDAIEELNTEDRLR